MKNFWIGILPPAKGWINKVIAPICCIYAEKNNLARVLQGIPHKFLQYNQGLIR